MIRAAAVLFLAAILCTAVITNHSPTVASVSAIVKTTSESSVVEKTVLAPVADLQTSKEIKVDNKIKTLVLEKSNVVVLRDQVTTKTISQLIKDIKKVSSNLNKDDVIYLVLDTPGGSVFDGLEFIDFMDALPQKVETITLFAASMGFHIAQHSNKRLITRNGVLMSHRASLGGLGGQLDGEFETIYRMIKRSVDFLDVHAAQRLGMTLKDYKSMIVNEYWVFGFDAVQEKAADEQILVRCGNSMTGTTKVEYQTMFGAVDAYFSNCPLIKYPEKVVFMGLDLANETKALNLVRFYITKKNDYLNSYIKTDKYKKTIDLRN